jgi:hypothetical protein
VAPVAVTFETAIEEIANVLPLTGAAFTGIVAKPEMDGVWVEVAIMLALPCAGAVAGAV